MFVTFGFVCLFQITFDLSAIPGDVAVSSILFTALICRIWPLLQHFITTGVNYAYSIVYRVGQLK